MSRLVLAQDGDEGYEALFLDGVKIDEGCPMNEGTDRTVYFAELALNRGFTLADITEMEVKEVDYKTLEGWQMFGYLSDNLDAVIFR